MAFPRQPLLFTETVPIMHTKLWRGTIDLVAKIELHCHLLYYFIVYQVRMIEGWRVQRKNRLNTEKQYGHSSEK